MTNLTTFTKATKSVLTLVANIGILGLAFISISSLLLLVSQIDLSLLPTGVEVYVSPEQAWGGAKAFVLTFVLANSLMIFGLIKLKKFLASFTAQDWLTEKTARFLQKGAILMTLAGLLQGVTEWSYTPHRLMINLSVAVYLFLVSLVIRYVNKRQTKKKTV